MNENQFYVLEWLKRNDNEGLNTLLVGGYGHHSSFTELQIVEMCSKVELYEVLSVFAEWGLRQC